jgi:sterol desaturase/sphingolipid hydroxylase (fatty acid hydroxylase superfamily)
MPTLLHTLQQTQTVVMVAGLLLMLLWETAHPFFDFFRQKPTERGRHAVRNLVMGGLNSVVVATVFVGLWLMTAEWARLNGIGLLHVWDLPAWAHAVGAILLLDGWTYVWHRINHRVPFLWRFHRVHHNDAQMDVTTASRFHLGEIVLSSALRIPLIVLFGVELWALVLYETLMFAVVQFHHANVAVPDAVDRTLRLLIVTPAMHKVHHSRWQPETDSNFSAFLSVWDRLGQSFRLRDDPSAIAFGLDGDDDDAHQSLKGMLRTPLEAPRREGE